MPWYIVSYTLFSVSRLLVLLVSSLITRTSKSLLIIQEVFRTFDALMEWTLVAIIAGDRSAASEIGAILVGGNRKEGVANSRVGRRGKGEKRENEQPEQTMSPTATPLEVGRGRRGK